MAKNIIGVAIVLFWLVMMLSLVRDKILPTRTAIQTTTVNVAEMVDMWEDVTEWEGFDEWHRIVSGKKVIGAMRQQVVRTDRPVGFLASFNFAVSLQLLSRDLKILALGVAQLDNRFQLDHFACEFSAWDLKLKVRALATDDGRLLVEVDSYQGEPTRYALELKNDISLLESVRPLVLKRQALIEGQSYVTEVIDPFFQMKKGELVLTVEGWETIEFSGVSEKMEAMRIRSQFGAIETEMWIDEEGRTLRRQLMPGRDIYLESPDAELLLNQNMNFKRHLQKTLAPAPLDPEDFDGIATEPIEALFDEEFLTGIFESLTIIPEHK